MALVNDDVCVVDFGVKGGQKTSGVALRAMADRGVPIFGVYSESLVCGTVNAGVLGVVRAVRLA